MKCIQVFNQYQVHNIHKRIVTTRLLRVAITHRAVIAFDNEAVIDQVIGTTKYQVGVVIGHKLKVIITVDPQEFVDGVAHQGAT